MSDSLLQRVRIFMCFSKDKETLRVEENLDFVSISQSLSCKHTSEGSGKTYMIYCRLDSLNIMV